VNLIGVRLEISGLAFQEQDQGAAVCASTALWSALQQVAHMAGHRTPTPSAITAAADSPFPASVGLDTYQMAQAIRRLGFVADYFAPLDDRRLFRAQLVACLRSKLPVILVLSQELNGAQGVAVAGHAVTVTGYDEPKQIGEVLIADDQPPVLMRGGTIRTIYVHDDNLGPQAHYELEDAVDRDQLGNRKLMLYRGDSERGPVAWWKPDRMEVCGALIPKTPKMRLSVESLLRQVLGVRELVQQVLRGFDDLEYDVRFAAGTAYRDEVIALPLDPVRLFDFLTALSLPRHVGVVSILRESTLLMEFVLDISEVRGAPRPAVLAIVAPGIKTATVSAKWLAELAEALDRQAIWAQ
jgi:hypothetical protein